MTTQAEARRKSDQWSEKSDIAQKISELYGDIGDEYRELSSIFRIGSKLNESLIKKIEREISRLKKKLQ